jgi:hypothetical protein
MAKNKAELESDAVNYRKAVSAMRTAHEDFDILRAIGVALSACQYIDGMMQFEKRFEAKEERKSVETIDYVFKYAPLVFDKTSLERIEELLTAQKRIDKIATDDLAARLKQAVELMWDARRLWIHIKENPGVPQNSLRKRLEGTQDRWRMIAESWEQLRMIERVPNEGSYALSLTTSLTAHVRGKCSSCGATGKATMVTLLSEIACPKCKKTVMFVILPVPVNS